MDIAQFIDLISKGGLVTSLIVIMFGGYKQLWVFGWSYTELVKDRDEWKRLALSNLTLAEKAADTARNALGHS